MAASASNQVFKLDVTTLDAGERGKYLVMLNFNLPKSMVEDDEPHSLEQGLSDVANLLDQEFFPEPVYYQVTASYNLRHRHTGDERLFTGSFMPKSSQMSSLSGPIFRLFQKPTFYREVREFTTPENILSCLEWPEDDDSDWSFLSLSSVILNCQVKVSWYNQFIVRRDLLNTRGGRHGRRHITFIYPW